MDATTNEQALPLDWQEWQAAWREWRDAHETELRPTRERFPGRNFLADERLGTWKVNGRVVELSSVTFPNLSERDEAGRLIEKQVRMIGITRGIGADADGGVARTFAELEQALGI